MSTDLVLDWLGHAGRARIRRLAELSVVAGMLVVACLVTGTADLNEYWVNPDEGIYYDIAHMQDAEVAANAVLGNVHPPLFYVILRCVAHLGGSIALLRLPSLLFACLSVLGLYAVGKRLSGTATGVAAALLFLLSPSTAVLSLAIRPYMLQTALIVWALFFLAGFCGTGQKRDVAGYAALAALSVLTHYSSCIFVGACAVAIAVAVFVERWNRRTVVVAVVAHIPVAVIAALLFLVHVRPYIIGSGIQSEVRDGWLSRSFPGSPGEIWGAVAGLFHYAYGRRYADTAMLCFGAGLCAAAVRRVRTAYILAPVAVVLGLIFALLRLLPFGGSRHCAYLVPLIALSMACTLHLCVPLKKRWPVAAIVGLLLVAPLPDGTMCPTEDVIVSGQSERILRSDDYRRVADLCRQVRDGGGVLLTDRQTHYLLTPMFYRSGPYKGPEWFESFYAYVWGRGHIIVSESWSLASGSANEERSSVASLVEAAGTELPAFASARRIGIRVAVGGWAASKLVQDGEMRGAYISDAVVVPGCAVMVLKNDAFGTSVSVPGTIPEDPKGGP